MTYNFLDGVNVDFEEGISDKEAPERQGLTLLVKELNEAAKRVSPYTQVTLTIWRSRVHTINCNKAICGN